MARWDPEKRVYYYTPGKNFESGIQEIERGNYYRSIFNYDEIPKIDFDMRLVPIQPAEDIFITDTTFRDGQQSMTPFSVEQIERIFDFLHRIGGDSGLIRGSEFFLYSKRTRPPVRPALPRGIIFQG